MPVRGTGTWPRTRACGERPPRPDECSLKHVSWRCALLPGKDPYQALGVFHPFDRSGLRYAEPRPWETRIDPHELQDLAAALGFPEGLWHDSGDGLLARFDGGQLVALCWRQDDAPDGSPTLELDPAARAGRLTWPSGSGGTADYEVYADGAWERFDAWSDSARPRPAPWPEWVRSSVTVVMGEVGCLLCGISIAQRPGVATTADGRGHLCADCREHVSSAAPGPRTWPRGDRVCDACGRRHNHQALLYEGPAGKLCAGCAGALRDGPRRA